MEKIAKAAVSIAAVATLTMSLGLIGCGSSSNKDSEAEHSDGIVSQAESNPDEVKIGKATMARDYKGKNRLVVEFKWTNNGDSTAKFFTTYSITTYQDGKEIDRTFGQGKGWYDDQKSVKPGKTQTFKAMYETKANKDVEVEISGFIGSDVIVSKTLKMK